MIDICVMNLRRLKRSLLNLYDKTTGGEDQLQTDEEFNVNLAFTLVRDCVNLIQAIEEQECEMLVEQSANLKRFTNTINNFETFNFPIHLHSFIDSKGLRGLLPDLHKDIEYLSEYTASISDKISDSHGDARTLDSSRAKLLCMLGLTECYQAGYEKYGTLNGLLERVQDYVMRRLLEITQIVEALDEVMLFVDSAELIDESTVEDYFCSFRTFIPMIGKIIVQSLQLPSVSVRRRFCLDNMQGLWSHHLACEEFLDQLHKLTLTFRSGLSYFESLRHPRSFNTLYSYDMQLHCIEEELGKL